MASLLTVALHGKLEYFTDILRTLLSDLVAQYVAKNPKLMLRRSVCPPAATGLGGQGQGSQDLSQALRVWVCPIENPGSSLPPADCLPLLLVIPGQRL